MRREAMKAPESASLAFLCPPKVRRERRVRCLSLPEAQPASAATRRRSGVPSSKSSLRRMGRTVGPTACAALKRYCVEGAVLLDALRRLDQAGCSPK